MDAMAAEILQHIPIWVYVVLAYVVTLGFRQSSNHHRPLLRATLMPLVMAALSLTGLQTSFAHEPIALLTWALGLAVALLLARAFGAWPRVRWLPRERMLFVPGSWAPLLLMLGVFVVKFTVNVMLAGQPSLASAQHFVAVTGLVYGGFSGAFVSRGIAMWLAARSDWRSTLA
jgi:hypothetical protein